MFTFEPGVAIWTIISFLIVVLVIHYKIYPPIRKVLDDRQAKIKKDLADAEEAKHLAKQMQDEIDDKLRNVKLEEMRILSEAREKARLDASRHEMEALSEIRELRKTKEQDLLKFEETFMHSSEGKLTGILIKACEKVLQTKLTESQQKEIVESRILELEKTKDL